MRLPPTVPLLAVLAGATLLLTACDDDPTRSEVPALMVCANLAEARTTEVTVAGGEEDQVITVGNHSLVVPANAIPEGEQVRFSLAQLPGLEVQVVVEVESNVQFASDLTLTLSYAGRDTCTLDGVPVANDAGLYIYNLDRSERLPRPDDGEQAVAGTTRSFSTFAIAG